MNTHNNQTRTMADFLADSKKSSIKSAVLFVFATFLMIGVVYTGLHNYNLFKRTVQTGQEIFALIPVILIEGSIVAFIVAGYVWFAGGTQKLVATISGWVMFGIVGLNTLVDSLMASGNQMPDWLHLYATFIMYGVPVAVMAVIKLLFDLDPSKRKVEIQKAMEHALVEGQFAEMQRALGSDTNRQALAHFGDQFGAALAAHIRAISPVAQVGQVVDGESRPIEKPNAPTMAMAKDLPDLGGGEVTTPTPPSANEHNDGDVYIVGESAFRTRETAEAVAKEWGLPVRRVSNPVTGNEGPKA